MRLTICGLACVLLCGCAQLPTKNFEARPAEGLKPPTPSQMESRRYYRAAQYWIARGDWVLGEELCWKALAALKESDPDHAHGAIRNNLVRPLMKNGKVDQAIEMGLAALVYNKRGRDPVGIACNYMNLGDAYEMKGDLAKRDAYWEMARTVAVENNLKETLPYIERRIKGAKRR